ncbi:MAG: hypothetical protein HQ567_33065, partial [Candidatus Nealsonbacteria bacterium]|nr:hypothetical protein [Candidatus Nealsonbacteria bacterium]
MRRNTTLTLICMLAILATCGPPATGADSKGPGGISRVFHVDCGAFAPGNPPWKAEYDDATIGAGYGYSVVGNAYRGGGSAGYCWFFTERGSATIRCPKGVEGTLYLKFVDLTNVHRKQTVTVCGRYTDAIEQFYEPAGKWCEYRLTRQDTAGGKISIELVKTGGANAVISRIDFVPAGVNDVLLPDRDPSQLTPDQTVEHDWRRQERLKRRATGCRAAVADALQRGEALLKDLADLGAGEVVSEAAETLAACRRRYDELAAREEANTDVVVDWNRLYIETRWTVRRAALSNPLLDFDELLFVKRFTPSVGHQCSHHVGASQIPGGDLCVLTGLKPDGKVRSVLGDRLPVGAIGRPDLSFDAERIVFPYAAPRPVPTAYRTGQPGEVAGACLDYQLYEMGVGSEGNSGTGLRKLTAGPYENTEPCYLPDGRICFTSSRCKTLVQCGDWAIVFSLFTMRGDGSGVRPITLAKEGEWWPSVLDDGRIVYMRWEYVLKPFNTIQYLWSVHPDGTKASLAYGDHFAFSPGPLTFIEPRQIPGTSKLIATGAAHHNCGVGPICIVDMQRNRGDAAGLVRVTPEVGYPETSDMASHNPALAGWYNAPYPLSEKHYLACYSFDAAHNSPIGYGIYLMDVHGNKELIYRDPQRSCYSPIPLRPRRKPPVLAGATRDKTKPATGTVLMVDVYEGLEGVPRGTIKHLRVLETICKTEHSTPQRLDVGIGSGWDPRRILGT